MERENGGESVEGLKRENERLRAELADCRRYKSILDYIPQTVSISDERGRIHYSNAAGLSSFRVGPAEMEAGISIFDLIAPGDVPLVIGALEALRSDSRPVSGEFTARRTDGSTFPAMIYCNPLKDAEGGFNGLLSIILDISGQKETEGRLIDSQEELKRAQVLLRESLKQTSAGIMVALAPDCQTFMVNAAAEEILGQDNLQSLAISDQNRRAIGWSMREPEGSELPVEEFPLERTVKRGDSFWSKEYVIRRKDGSERFILVSGGPVHNETGEIIAGIIVFPDITDKKRAEKELQKVQNLESLGILAGGIAHDFNNILTVLLGNLSLLKLGFAEDDPDLPLLADMGLAIARAERLTFQLLTFAKGGAPIKETAGLEEILRDSAGFVLRGSAVQCRYSIQPGLWPAELDKGQISQVIQNLVLNAVQAMPSGGDMEIRAENLVLGAAGESEAAGLPMGDYVRVSVRDDGPGIPSELLRKVFDPYFTTKEKGTGLGLAIAYSIMHRHGGSIAAESAPGRGSTFRLLLPACPEKAAGPRAADSCLVRAAGLVLVMDDEPGLRSVLCKFLSRLGLQTLAVADGKEAVEAFERARGEGREFRFAVLDLTIPGGMGGLETLRALRGMDPGLRAIVCSGYSQDTIMSSYLDHGFSGILKKPFDLPQVSRAVEELLGGAG